MPVNFQTSACKARASFGLNSGKRLSEGLTNHQPAALLQRGFTLIELLAVITLLALIASVAIGVSDVSGAEYNLSQVEMAEIRKSMLQFKRDVGHFPDAGLSHDDDARIHLLWKCQRTDPLEDDFDAGCQKPYNLDTKRGWNGPYVIARRVIVHENKSTERGFFDPWGNRYLLLNPENATPGEGTARIVSKGPDGIYNGINNVDACMHADGSDDIVLCLVQ